MASSFLGPESPRPLAVVSESYQRQLQFPYIPENSRFSFGPEYEFRLVQAIDKHLELGTLDRLCYIGDSKGSLATLLEDRFCLLEPIVSVVPFDLNLQESSSAEHFQDVSDSNRSNNPQKAQNDMHLLNDARKIHEGKYRSCFDRIILKDAIQYFENALETYRNILRLVYDNGRILIIHRPNKLCTLPYFNDAKLRLSVADISHDRLLLDLYAAAEFDNGKWDIQWNLESLPAVMPKTKWLGMISEQFPPETKVISNFEMIAGLRELTEGVFKYESEVVEFVDRLVFITLTPSRHQKIPYSSGLPLGRRVVNARQKALIDETMFKLPLEGELKNCAERIKEAKQRSRQLRKQKR